MAEKEYIEREKLNDMLEDFCVNESFYDALQTIPAADVAPVKHGCWISLDDYFEDAQCSECGDALVIGDCSFNDFCEGYKYCPNCGAKMDGGEGE